VIETNHRLYELKEVNKEYLNCPYKLHLINENDLHYLPYWYNGFHNDCFADKEDMEVSTQTAAHQLSTKALYILKDDDNSPLTMASNHRNLITIGGVGYVYTPKHLRRNGYATYCVALLSKIILESGKKSCVLYADLNNPISNSIYLKIGFKPVCDSLAVKFVENIDK
jgi:predicted GNAT family acetyltransferase